MAQKRTEIEIAKNVAGDVESSDAAKMAAHAKAAEL